MENLEVITYNVAEISSEKYGQPLCSSFYNDGSCSFTTNKGKVCTYDNFTSEFTKTTVQQDSSSLRNIKYFPFEKAVFMTDDHNIIVNSENIFTMPNKILDLTWSPISKYFVVIDDKNEINGFSFEMGQDLKNLVHLHKGHLDDTVPNSVYVGWGSHNTQFRGSKKTEDVIEEIPQEYLPPKISIRGNGEELVINFWKDNKRYLKVFTSSLKPLYQSDVYPNLMRATAFKGQGNCIACAAVHDGRNKIVIFEKNCLVRSEFFVPENKGTIQEILYHPDVNLIGVYSLDTDNVGYLNIYTISNAKWYLKQQFLYSPELKLKCFFWTPLDHKSVVKLSVLSSNIIEFYEFRWIVSRSPVSPLVAVLDGVEVYVTLFSKRIIPPPLYGNVLKFTDPINRIVFHPYFKRCLIIDSHFVVRGFEFKKDSFSEKIALFTAGADSQKGIMSLIDAFWAGDLENFVSKDKGSGNELRIPVNDTTEILPLLDRTIETYRFHVYSTGKTINGVLYRFSLTYNNILILNDNEVSTNVNSIFLYKDYLLFTHLSAKLYCVRLSPENLNKANWELSSFFSHEIELGAIIVCVTSDAVILQIPRGNLETISCRLISIDLIEKLLSKNNWDQAVSTIRQERLNWNILIDLNPERFARNIENFIKAASTVFVLNTIICEFTDTNCLKTLYGHSVKSKNYFLSETDLSTIKKKIFFDILDFLNKVDPIANLVGIVALQIKHFSLKSALKSVCDAYEIGEIDVSKKAVSQILLYTHANSVITTAYTLYNIGFVGFVYTCCAEDPKIYEPVLEKLKSITDPVKLRFEMNVESKNFKTATKYLLRCETDDIIVRNFIMKHNTQYTAFESCPKENPNFQRVSKLMATKVSLKGRRQDAGLILYRAGLLEDSLREFKNAANWSKVSSLVGELKLDEKMRTKTFSELAENLKRAKKFEDAALCYQYELKNFEQAIDVYMENQQFQRALQLAVQQDDKDLIANKIIPALTLNREAVGDRVDELLESILKYTNRLETVRNSKLFNLRNSEMLGFDQFGDDDLYSESGSTISSRSSTGSSRSRTSSKSSRSHKKEAKKKVDLREGGFYEDIAIIRHLHILITDIFKIGNDVREICETYMMVKEDNTLKLCQTLHNQLCNAQNVSKRCIPRIWTDVFLNSSLSNEPVVLTVVQNKEDLEEKYRKPPPSESLDQNWKLSWFEESLFLSPHL